MNVISKKVLVNFIKKHNQAEGPLMQWWKSAKKADWSSLIDVQAQFPAADYAAPYTIFNVGGNKYRLSTEINYKIRFVFIRFVETHAEYTKRNK